MRKYWIFGLVMLLCLANAMATPPIAVAGTNTTNATSIGQLALLSQQWTDVNGTAGYILSTHFTGGSWTNGSYTSMTGVSNWSNATTTLSSTQGITSWRYYVNNTLGAETASSISYINTYSALNETFEPGTCPVTDTPSALIFILIGVLLVSMAVIGKTWATMPIWNMMVGLAMIFYSFPLYGCYFIFGGIITAFGLMIAGEAVITWRLGK